MTQPYAEEPADGHATSVSGEIECFIIEELAQGSDTRSIDFAENLFATGIIDSHGLIMLVDFLQQRYGVSIGNEDLAPEAFESIASIAEFVTRQRTRQR